MPAEIPPQEPPPGDAQPPVEIPPRTSAQHTDEGKRKPASEDEQMDRTVGKVPDPEGKTPERKRDDI